MKSILPLAFLFILTLSSCDSVNETTGDLSGTSAAGTISDDDLAGNLLPKEPKEEAEEEVAEEEAENSCSVDETIYLSESKILNGSFEEGHNLDDNRWDVYESLGAWEVDTSYNDAGVEVQHGQRIGGLAPSNGNTKVELDGHRKNGFTASDVALYQDIDTDAASDYILSFDYSPRVKNNNTTNKAEVYWDGQLVATLNATVVGWQKYTLRLKGAGDMTRLTFKAYIDSDTYGAYLDNVTLNEVLPDELGAELSIEYRACQSEVSL